MNAPMTLQWEKCSCHHPSCKRGYPANFGTFCQGTGFDPDEKALIERAFTALRVREALAVVEAHLPVAGAGDALREPTDTEGWLEEAETLRKATACGDGM